MTDRVAECTRPEAESCRGCKWSYAPGLFDGGCKLHYEREPDGRGGLKSPPPPETDNEAERHAHGRKIKRGYNPGEENRE